MALSFPKHRRYEVSFEGISGLVLIEVPFDERALDLELREADVWGIVYKEARRYLHLLDRRRFLAGYHPEQPGQCYKIERTR